MRLSKYFTLAEMIQSETAARKGIRNNPGKEAIENLRLLCVHVLDPVREHYGRPITPTSGYRSPALNAAIGGAPNSQHTRGQAVDFVVPGVPVPEVCKWIASNLEYDQLIQEFWNPSKGTGWVHVSYSSTRNRRQFLKIG